MTDARVIYPRFLGVDGNGDFVWELADDRWTWGDDPFQAANRKRTFEPERYIEKYGRPIGIGEEIDRKAEAELDPAELARQYAASSHGPKWATLVHHTRRSGAHRALRALLDALDGWIQGARENHEASGHRGEIRGGECWREFAPSDIRRMVNDAAREMGLDEFAEPEPGEAREDKPL